MIDRLIAAQLVTIAYVSAGLDRVRSDDRQRGVVSVEYIVLGAAIIALVVYVAVFSRADGTTEASRWHLR